MKAALKLLSLFWLGIMCIVLILWVVKSCHEYQIMKDVENHLTADFKSMGYKGKVTVKNYDRPAGYGETMDFSYEEKIDGRLLTFSDSVDYDPTTKQYEASRLSPVPEETETGLDDSIQLEAMWQQPYVQKQFKKMKSVFKKLEDEELTLKEISGETMEVLHQDDGQITSEMLNAGQAELVQDFQKNRQKGLPLNGYYNVDVESYLQKHTLQLRVNYELLVDDLYDDEKARDKYPGVFFQKLKKLDYSQFWDGYYLVGYDLRERSGSGIDGNSEVIMLDIRGGKLVRTFSAF